MPPGESADGGLGRYSLRVPCKRCPFRTDVPPYLRRAESIAEGIDRGGDFACHRTTVKAEDDEGSSILVDDPAVSKVCAGSLAIMIREDSLNQMARIAFRLGMFDPDGIDAFGVPVYDSFADWVKAHHDAEAEGCVLDGDPGDITDDDL